MNKQTNLFQKILLLVEENEQLLEKIKELEKELYDCKVLAMHLENDSYSKSI